MLMVLPSNMLSTILPTPKKRQMEEHLTSARSLSSSLFSLLFSLPSLLPSFSLPSSACSSELRLTSPTVSLPLFLVPRLI